MSLASMECIFLFSYSDRRMISLITTLFLFGWGIHSTSGCQSETPGYCLSQFRDIPQDQMTEEQQLLYKLMKGYDRASRPVFQAAKPVLIRLGITLTQVLDMDEKNQILTTNVWLDQEWIDERLIWSNWTDAPPISMLRIPCDLLWLPDIVLYNSVDNHNKGYMRSLAMVQSNGNVFWPPIVRMRSSCKMDITYFPFDDQICRLKLGSWAYDGFQVDVTNRTLDVDLSNFVDNGEWTLIDTKVKRNVIYYPCCPEPFPDVMFYIHLRRRVLFYFFNVIIPCMLLSVLTLTGFCLPPDSGEKITLGLTVLLAFSVFMLLIAENMPPTSEYIPLIGIYLTVIMAMSALSVVFSVIVLNIHHKGGFKKGPPFWLKSLTSLISRILCSKTHFHQGTYTPMRAHINYQLPSQEPNRVMITHETGNYDNPDIVGMNGGIDDPIRTRTTSTTNNNENSQRLSLDEEILKYFNAVLASHESTVTERKSIHDWQEVARVMDKLFFWIFLTITIVSTFVLLVICPMTKSISLD